jgi:hypothetical protein
MKLQGPEAQLHVGGIAVAKRLKNTLTVHQSKGAAESS